MYSFLLYLYQIGVWIASFRSKKVKKMWKGEQDAFNVLRQKASKNSQYVWFHAASLGEFEQARPIIERLKAENPKEKILLTFFSPSGYEVRKNYEHADIICYLPIDTITNAYRFLSLINIKKAYFIKYEFWWNYLHILRRRNIPVYSVSSIFREGQIFFRWYGYQYKRVLKCFTHFFVQNQLSKDLLAKIGITGVTVTGDTRFDRVLAVKKQAMVLPIVEAFKDGKNVFVAGSSWQPDEDIFIKYFNEHNDWKLIIAPHVIGEDHLKDILSKLQRKTVFYKDFSDKQLQETEILQLQEADVLIINCFGLLSSIYRYGEIAYVGGGFGVGIHNVLEAAVWGVPVLFGPNNKKFQEAQALKEQNSQQEIHSYEDFSGFITMLTTDDEARNKLGLKNGLYVQSQAKATDIVLEKTK